MKDELGFDECVDHRDPALAEKLKAACPKGIDVYFENVSGAVWDAVFPLLNPFARIPVCGLIAQYSATESPDMKYKTSQIFRAVLTKRLTIRGFIVTDFAAPLRRFHPRRAAVDQGRPDQVSRGHRRRPRECARRPSWAC